MSHTYSPHWFSTFLATVPASRTNAEVGFLMRQLPPGSYHRVLDIACGRGRHANGLGAAGYAVTGVDVDATALDAAREHGNTGVDFVHADMRELRSVGSAFDAAICMWQSFGHFDAATNRAVLRQVRHCLRPRGRFVLDIYDRRFFETRQGVRRAVRNGIEYEEHTVLAGRRLIVQLSYAGSDAADRFDWEVFTPDEIVAVAREAGFEPALLCRDFDETSAVTDACPRMQLVLDRGA
jgi:SAM-dependent methyltransferase